MDGSFFGIIDPRSRNLNGSRGLRRRGVVDYLRLRLITMRFSRCFFSHLSLSVYPLRVICTTQLSGILRPRYPFHFTDLCTIVGGMNTCPSARVKKQSVTQKGACSPSCVFHTFAILHHFYVRTMRVHLPFGSIPISSTFHTWSARGWIRFKYFGITVSLSIDLETASCDISSQYFVKGTMVVEPSLTVSSGKLTISYTSFGPRIRSSITSLRPIETDILL